MAGDLDEEIITTTECEYKSHLWGHLEEIILAFTYSIPFFLFCTNWKRINNTVKLVIKTYIRFIIEPFNTSLDEVVLVISVII